MNKLNILFLSSWYPNSELPFNGNFIRQHAFAVSLNCNVAVLHVQGRKQKNKIEISENYFENIYEVIVYFKKDDNSNIIENVKKILRQKKSLNVGFEIINKYFEKRIDLIHLNVILPLGWFAYYKYRTIKIPYIITEHHTKYLIKTRTNFSFIEKNLIKIIVKNARKVCPVSHDLKEAFIYHGFNGDFQVVPNVVDKKFFYNEPNEIRNKFVLLHVSSLNNNHKNVFGIINVFKQLHKYNNNFFLRIIGDGDKILVSEYAKNKGLNENSYSVEGPMQYQQIGEAMRKAGVFLLFSNYENLPCVISESLVSGLPVISSNVGGISEMINDTNGVLIAANDEKGLYKKIIETFDNLDKYKRDEIAENAIQKYGFQEVANIFLGIYKNV